MKLLAACLMLSLAGCSALSNVDAVVPTAYQIGCSAISIANGDFIAVAPALLLSNTINQADIDAEKALFALDQARCANPPANLVTAANDLLADAATIYLMLTPRQSIRRLRR
jgi:hypothetical protein